MKKVYLIIWILAVSFISYCFFPVINYYSEWKPGSIYLTDRNWTIITDKPNKFGYNITYLFDLESRIVKDIIMIEDKNYYNHYWVDILSKLGALKLNISAWKNLSWWSTITEQYIKNHFFNGHKRTYLQKFREAFLSFYYSFHFLPNTLWENETRLKLKNKILNLYLRNAYFWNNIYWIKTAATVYFWKEDLNELNEEEIVLLISLLNNPWTKSIEEKRFTDYFNRIKNKLWYKFEREIFKLNWKESIDKFPFVTNNLRRWYDSKTDIDAELQQFTKDIIKQTLNWLESKNVTNAAVYAINPRTREVLIYQWSKDFYDNDIDWQVNVINSPRQPGSTMKPFLYLLALNQWAGINDLLIDVESEYDSFSEWKTYISNNYSLKEYWLIRFKKALWNSLNNSTVRLAREIWLENIYNFYRKYWFNLPESPEYYWYSLVLWNPSITLKDLVYSYSKLVPFKFRYNPETYKIENLWYTEDVNKILLYDILSDPDNRDISFWVNSILNTSIPQAVKTWTSSNFRDNLVVSYHPDFVIWVWVWNNDNSPMKWVTWITGAWYIWHQVVEKAISLWYINDYGYILPSTIIEKEYCLDKKCYRKEINYDKINQNYKSKILDWDYSSEDMYEKISSEEMDKLEKLWFNLK